MSTLRATLKEWVNRARQGQEVVVTDRGVPVAKLVPVDVAPVIERLTREGVISRPRSAVRPKAAGRPRVQARGSVSQLVSEQRR